MKREKIFNMMMVLALGTGVLVNGTEVLATENNSLVDVNVENYTKNEIDSNLDRENTEEDLNTTEKIEEVTEINNENDIEDSISVNNEILDGPRDNEKLEKAVEIFAEKHSIMGQAQVNKEAFKRYFKAIAEKNSYIYKLNCTIDEFVDLAYEEAAIEGVRGDIVIAQAIWETGYFQYGGIVDANDNNYAGIGATGAAGVKEKFDTPRLGLRAQIQHLKAYASTESLVLDLIDPRFKYVTRGSAPSVEELSGKWAVPGYSTSSYSSLANAAKNNDTYGQRIYNLVKAAIAYNSAEDNNSNNGNGTNQTPENSAPEVTIKIGTVKVNTSLNVRKGPGTSYSIVDRLYNGKQVTIIGEESGFYKVQYDGKEGYVSKEYVTISASNNNTGSNSGTVAPHKTGITTNTTANLNVRKGAGTNYSVIGTLKPKSQVIILSEENSWLKVAYYVNGTKIEGYVSASYVKIN
ncbi:MAG: SH3 domain-containing protein [Clostridium perfringens]|nr:SH3 domain-containing protein [Clostridium perfringens]